jgi:hypothetical protein
MAFMKISMPQFKILAPPRVTIVQTSLAICAGSPSPYSSRRNAFAGFPGPQSPCLLHSAWSEAKIEFPVGPVIGFQIILGRRLRFIVGQAHDRYCTLSIAGELGEKLTVEASHFTKWTTYLTCSVDIHCTLA